jgi:hypothetical protein
VSVEITGKTKENLEDKLNNSVSTYLKQKKELYSFQIGDVLIMKAKWRDGTWHNVKNSHDSKLDQRFVYIHEDEAGIGYISKLKVSNGKLGDEVFCMATDFDYENQKFEVDPEYAESQFLGGEFSIKDMHNKVTASRKIATNMNKKIGTRLSSLKEVRDFFSSLKPGDVFYTSENYTGRKVITHTFRSIKSVKVEDMENAWEKRDYLSRYPGESVYSFLITDKVTYWGSTYKDHETRETYFVGDIFFKTKPATEGEING